MAVHIVQAGNIRQTSFISIEVMATYADSLLEGAGKFGLEIHLYVFAQKLPGKLFNANSDQPSVPRYFCNRGKIPIWILI